MPHTERARPYVVRLSLLYALADRSQVIRCEHLQAALAVWEYCRESARLLFGGTHQRLAEPLWLQVLNAIRTCPGINKSDLLRAFRSSAAGEIDQALQRLKAQGWAYDSLVQTGGRPAECWWAVGDGAGGVLSPDNPPLPSPWVVQADADGGKEGKNSEPSADPQTGTSFLPSQGEQKSEASGLTSFLPTPKPPQADANDEVLTDEQVQAELEAIRLMVLPKD